eukprot:gene1374-800_t
MSKESPLSQPKRAKDAAWHTTDGLLTPEVLIEMCTAPDLVRWHLRTTPASAAALADWSSCNHLNKDAKASNAHGTSILRLLEAKSSHLCPGGGGFQELEELILDGWSEPNTAPSSAFTAAPPHKPGSDCFSWWHLCRELKSLSLVRSHTAAVLASCMGAVCGCCSGCCDCHGADRPHHSHAPHTCPCGTTEELPETSPFRTLTSLSISHDPTLQDLSLLKHFPNLTSLSLKFMKHNLLTSSLRQILATTTAGLTTSRPLGALQHLKVLDLSNTGLSDVEWMRVRRRPESGDDGDGDYCSFPHLEELRLVGCDRLFSLNPLLSAGEEDAEEAKRIEKEYKKPPPSEAPAPDSAETEPIHDTKRRRSAATPNHHTLLVRLRVLDISWSGINDLRCIHHCADTLQELYINGCKTIGDHHEIGQLHALRVLHAENNTFTTLDWISGCQALRDLDLGRGVMMEDLSPLGALPQLERLGCPSGAGKLDWHWLESATEMDAAEGPPPPLLLAKSLRELQIDSASGLQTGACLAALAKLRSLVLTSVHITALSFLDCLPLLEVVCLTDCRALQTEAYEPLSRLRHLRYLQLCDCTIKEVKGFLHPGAACVRSLEEVELTLCSSLHDITGMGLVKHLRRVMISEASLGDVAEELQKCVELEEVDISYVDTLEDFTFLRQLPLLKSLSISRTAMSELAVFDPCHTRPASEAVTTTPPPYPATGLADLHISHCFMLDRFPSLATVANTLRTIHLLQCSVEHIEGLEECTLLSELYIGQCPDLEKIQWEVHQKSTFFPHLTRITVHHCERLKSLNWLQSLCKWKTEEGSSRRTTPPALQDLKIANCKSIQQGEWLAGLRAAVGWNPTLTRLELSETSLPGCTAPLSTWMTNKSPVRVAAEPCKDPHSHPDSDPDSCQETPYTWRLTEIHLSGLSTLTSLDGVEGVPYLSTLCIANCTELVNIRAVGKCRHLLHFDISRCRSLASFDGVWEAPESGTSRWYPPLKLLKVSSLPLLSSFGSSLRHCRDLCCLSLSSCSKLQDILPSTSGNDDEFLQLREVKVLDAGITHMRWLRGCPNVEDIEVSFGPLLTSVEGVERLRCLRRLAITQCSIQTLEPLRQAVQHFGMCLEEADFSLCACLQDIRGLAGLPPKRDGEDDAPPRVLPRLKRLSGYGTGVTDISWLELCCPAVEKIDFRECSALKAFGDISAEKNVTEYKTTTTRTITATNNDHQVSTDTNKKEEGGGGDLAATPLC